MPNRWISETERQAKFKEERLSAKDIKSAYLSVRAYEDARKLAQIKLEIHDTKIALKDKRNDKEQLLNLFFERIKEITK